MQFRRKIAAITIIGMAFVCLVMFPARGQDGPPAELIKQIAQFLSQQLNKPITTIDNFTFQGASFPDSSLGCPVSGKTYQPGPIPGYKFVINLKGVSYDVRTNQTGSQIVLCANSDVKQTVTLATYRSPQFSIGYPDSWQYNKHDPDVFFGLGPTPACAQPGMTVTSVGRVTTETPDILLDQYIQNNTGGKFEKDRFPIKNTGQSVLYTTTCSDGTIRQARVSIFVAFNNAYRVVQFAPQNVYPQWADAFIQILNSFSAASVGAGGGNGQAVVPLKNSPLALLGHVFANNVYVGTMVDLPGTPITTDGTPDHDYQDAVISPDGKWVTFINFQDGTLLAASTAPTDTSPLPTTLVPTSGKLAPFYRPAWSPDSTEILYFQIRDVDTTAHSGTLSLHAIKVDGSGDRELTNFKTNTDTPCTALLGDPSDLRYYNDVGGNKANGVMLTWSKTGEIYFSPDCTGIGVSQLKTGEASKVLNPDLRRAQLSPDGTQLIGLIKQGDQDQLTLVNAIDGALTPLKTALAPEQLAWNADEKAIFYSSAAIKKSITLDDASGKNRGMQTFGDWPITLNVYEVTLHRLDLESGADTELFKSDARAIGRILPSPDGNGVLFTLIQSVEAYANAFKNSASDADLARFVPSVQLYWRSTNAAPGSTAQLMAISSFPSWGPLGSALAPTPTGGFHITASPTGNLYQIPTATPSKTPTRTATANATSGRGALATNTPRGPIGTPTPTTPGTVG